MVAAPDGGRSVRPSLDLELYRHESCRPVVLWPVELHTSRYPRACQTHERRLDYVLAIKEIVAINLVEPYVDAPTDLRQHHQTQILVLDVNRLPRTFLPFGCDPVNIR